jgi:hypothetical protein
MAAFSYQLTLSGSAQHLSDAFGDGTGVVNPIHDIPFRALVLQAQKAGADVFVGTDKTVSSTVFGVRLDPTASAPPLVLGGFDQGPLRLSDFWVVGTNTQVLTILGIPV